MNFDRCTFFQRLTAAAGLLGIPKTAHAAQQHAVLLGEGLEQQIPVRTTVPPHFNELLSTMIDRRPHLWYDHIHQPGGTEALGVFHPFVNALGQPDEVTMEPKSLMHTNMWQGSQFSPPMVFLLRRIGFLIHPDMTDVDALAFSRDAYFEFQLLTKVYLRGRLDWQISGPDRGHPAALHTKFFELDEPLVISSLQYFSLRILFMDHKPTWEPLGNGLSVFTMFDGIADFAVQ